MDLILIISLNLFLFVIHSINLGSTGIISYFEIPKKKSNGLKKVYEFVLTTALSLTVQDEYIYTKVITISPKYVFYNSSQLCLQIVQEDCFESVLSVKPGESKAFHWPNNSRERFVLIRLRDDNFSQWDWSSPLELQELGSITVKCRHQMRIHNHLLLKIDRAHVEGVVVTKVREESQDYPAYRIENYSQHFSLAYWQKGKQVGKEYLNTLTQVAFGWTDYRLPKILEVKFYYGGLYECPIDLNNEEYEFSLDDLGKTTEIKIRTKNRIGYVLYISTLTNGHTKILRITDVQSDFDVSAKEEKLQYNYFLDVKSLIIL